MGGGKNIKQKEDKGSREVFSKVEGIYSGRRYMGKKGELKECRRINRRV